MACVGDEVAGYTLKALLGQGGMGAVFRARKAAAAADVALKLLHGRSAPTEEAAHRFRRETLILAALDHPALARVRDFGVAGEVPYLALELVEGTTLRDLCSGGGLPEWASAARVAAQLAGALAYLHGRGVVHRDLSPTNVMITDTGAVKILDFGLARAPDMTVITREGAAMGTPLVMAPEVIGSGAFSPASDLWALGCLLYLMLAGRPPFAAETGALMLARILSGPPDPLPRRADLVPRGLASLVKSLLVKDPAQRGPPAAELARRLEALLASGGDHPIRWRRAIAACASAGACAVALAARMWWPPIQRSQTPAPQPSPARSVASTPAPPSAVSLPWLRFRHLLPALRQGGPPAERAIRELRRLAPFDLGLARESWIGWFELEGWLASGGSRSGPPRRARAAHGYMEAHLIAVLRSGVRHEDADNPAVLMGMALRWTLDNPDDGCCWLVLGLALERLDRPADARLAWRLASERITNQSLLGFHFVFGTAAARAIVAGTGAERHLRALLGEAGPYLSTWDVGRSFLSGLEDLPAPRRAAILGELGLVDSTVVEVECTRLLSEGRASQARARLERALATPQSTPEILNRTLAKTLLAYLRDRPGAQRSLAVTSREEPLRILALDGPVAEGLNLKWPPTAGRMALRHLLDGEREQARTTWARGIETARETEPSFWNVAAVQIAGAGGRGPELEAACILALTSRDPSLLWPAWDAAAGGLHDASGDAIVRRALDRIEAEFTDRPIADLPRALRLSRMGRHEEALDALETGLRRTRARFAQITDAPGHASASAWIAEILARPLWTRARPASSLAARIARISEWPPLDERVTAIVSAARAGDEPGSRVAARALFATHPDHVLGVLEHTLEVRQSGDRTAREAWRRELDAYVRGMEGHLWLLRDAN